MGKAAFSPEAVPSFEKAPSVVLIVGDVEFFVEEAAAQALEKLGAKGAEVLRFEDEAPADAVSDALLNRSLFSPQRIVQFDITRLLGTESPGALLEQAVEAWQRGTPAGKREAYRRARAVLSALDLSSSGAPEETAETVARRARKKDLASPLAEILRELPEERGGPAMLTSALRLLLERENDGTVALLTATAPPAGVDLAAEIAKKGLILAVSVVDKPDEIAPALARLARSRAKERDVVIDNDAIERLRASTDGNPALFAAELSKLLEWAGPGGHIRAADVRESVEDESSEDVYEFYEAVGRRDAGDALARLERLLSGRAVRAGERGIDTEEYWPTRLLGMLAEEVRRMLVVRARLEETGRGFDASMSYGTFQARVLPALAEPVAPFGVSAFPNTRAPYALFKAAQRAARFTTRELGSALARAADVDVKLKNSSEPLETLTAYVGELIAGNTSP
jgi:DNA polymerase III delta subunit